MDTKELEQKVARLKTEFFGQDSASEQTVREWEARVKAAVRTNNAKKNPAVKMIIQEAQKRIEKVNTILLNDRKLSDVERDKLFEQRDFYRWILNIFDEAEKAIKQIANQ